MRRGGKEYWGHRGGEPYGGHGTRDISGNKLEPLIREYENYNDPIDDPPYPWDTGNGNYGWDTSNDDDDDEL